MSVHSELTLASHQLEIEKVAADYCHISPRVPFGAGGIPMLERLLAFEEHEHIYSNVRDPATAVVGGWIALEIASHMPTKQQRAPYLDRATQRFESIAAIRDSKDSYDRLTSYEAGLGLIAVNAYGTDVETAMYDTPGLYTEMIEQLMADDKMRQERKHEQWGMLGELTVGAVISSLEFLALPASVRHDKPVTTETPSFAHDLQVWFNLPDNMPKRPSRHVQVKTSPHNNRAGRYSDAISLFNTHYEFKNKLNTIARSMIIHYSGEKEGIPVRNVIRNSQLAVLEHLNEEVGHDTYKYRGYRMRGSGNRRK